MHNNIIVVTVYVQCIIERRSLSINTGYREAKAQEADAQSRRFELKSNLSFISKVVERVAADRLSAHFESQDLLPSRQSAYRANHSTETAITAVYDEIVGAVDSGDMCALELLDLSSAFDTVDHETLLTVSLLHRRFGISGVALDWCRGYLSDRTQTFQAGPQLSGPHNVQCSVPQGSVLGPKKFIAYAEDLASSERHQSEATLSPFVC